jgi:hypothetical protein
MARGAKKGERRGGRSKGKGNKSTQEIKDIIDANVDFNIVVQKMFELVEGIEVKGTNKDSTTYLMDLQPNPLAAKLLLEYRFGKPRETIDHSLDFPDGYEITIGKKKKAED